MSELKAIEPDYLKQCLRYDHVTGDLVWIKRPRSHFKSDRLQNSWNGQWSGKQAGTVNRNSDTLCYRMIKLNNSIYPAHRLAWIYHHGAAPDGEIDHIDGDGLNNSITNLRVVTKTENSKNTKITVKNKYGVMGVYWKEAISKWTASIRDDKSKQKHLGVFADWFDAVCARKSAENRYGYHPNHGRSVQQAMEQEK